MLTRIVFTLCLFLVMGISYLSRAQTTGEMLGYGANDKLLIVNADDFGMCHAENAATMDLLVGGHVTSATIMVPCPWFEESWSLALGLRRRRLFVASIH